MNLKDLMVPVVEAWFDVDGYDGFKVKLAYLTKDEIGKLRSKASNTKFSRKSRTLEENIDMDLFQDLYIKAIFKDWKGLKLSYLSNMIPLDLSNIEDPDNEELEFTPENAVTLMKNCEELDSFISECISDLGNFTQRNTGD